MSAYRQPQSQRVIPVIIVAVILLGALGVGFLMGTILAGGQAGTATGSQTPGPTTSAAVSSAASATGAASASAAPSGQPVPSGPAPSPVVAAPDGLIPPGSAVRVLADGLRLRDGPSTDAALVQNLPLNQLLVVGFAPQVSTFGPIAADGFTWYPVLRLGDLTELPELSSGPLGSESAVGWVAGGDASDPYVELLAPRCPPRPVDLATLEAMLPWEQLTCFGNETITIEGTFGCVNCAPGRPAAGSFEPAWLARPDTTNYLSVDASAGIGPTILRLAPTGPTAPEVGAVVRVTGHFDDDAASTCVVSPDEATTIDATSVALYCRAQYVADSIEIIGSAS